MCVNEGLNNNLQVILKNSDLKEFEEFENHWIKQVLVLK